MPAVYTRANALVGPDGMVGAPYDALKQACHGEQRDRLLLAQDAYLRAWAARPTRAEPLSCIARHYRVHGEYRLGHLFAKQAAEIPLPVDDVLFVQADVYEWRAVGRQVTWHVKAV